MARGRFDSTRVPSRTLRYARNVYLTVRLIEANRAILSAYTRTSVRYATRRHATRRKALIRRATGCSDLIAFVGRFVLASASRYALSFASFWTTRNANFKKTSIRSAACSVIEKGKGKRIKGKTREEKGKRWQHGRTVWNEARQAHRKKK